MTAKLPLDVRAEGPEHSKVAASLARHKQQTLPAYPTGSPLHVAFMHLLIRLRICPQTFTATLAVPLPYGSWMAVGKGRNKSEAERMCCVAACEKLYQEGLLYVPSRLPPSSGGGGGGAPGQQRDLMDELPVLHVNAQALEEMETVMSNLQDVYAAEARQQMGASSQPRGGSKNGDLHERLGRSRFGAGESMAMDASNSQIQREAQRRVASLELREQRKVREALPAWKERDNILKLVQENRVIVLTGETGCGKTTQVPQYILETAEGQGTAGQVRVIITQPRRIAAISVAERVAWERGEPIGRSVGYAVRLESVAPRMQGSLLFCTTGILLRNLQNKDYLATASHIIIDEVHERDVNTDFLLIVVKELLPSYPSLRIIIMSATLDSDSLTRYFGSCPHVHIPGFLYPVQISYLEDLPQLMGSACPLVVKAAAQGRLPAALEEDEVDPQLTAAVIGWYVDHVEHFDGAVLCFLPGWETISKVTEKLMSHSAARRMHIVPLHSQLPVREQHLAFRRAPEGYCKIVLATNIAETSITIDDIVCVVDLGRHKMKAYDSSRDITAMRVQIHAAMYDQPIPEMLRMPLEEVCLQIKSLAVTGPVEKRSTAASEVNSWRHSSVVDLADITTFLARALQPPKASAVYSAIRTLRDMGALDKEENLTPLGQKLSKLAVHPRLGKMLIYAALLGCLPPLLTVAAAACFRDPFLSPMYKRDEADRIRLGLATGAASNSDHLVVARAFEMWEDAQASGRGFEFCDVHFLAVGTMQLIAGTRKQFERELLDSGLWQPERQLPDRSIIRVARCALTVGMHQNIAYTEMFKESKGYKSGSKKAYRTKLGFKSDGSRVFIHPTSVVSEKRLDQAEHHFLLFQEKVASTSQVFVKTCTLVSPINLGIFGGSLRFGSNSSSSYASEFKVMEVNEQVKLLVKSGVGEVVVQIRRMLDEIVERWLLGVQRNELEIQFMESLVNLLVQSL
eukprot:SM000001S04489  [mRNA]  locus=s1:509072:515466:+ [translate_table: standard]